MSDESEDRGSVTEHRRQRATLGASAMLLAPLLLLGALLLANTSNDSRTTTAVVWSYVLAIIGLAIFVTGGVLWLRHRK